MNRPKVDVPETGQGSGKNEIGKDPKIKDDKKRNRVESLWLFACCSLALGSFLSIIGSFYNPDDSQIQVIVFNVIIGILSVFLYAARFIANKEGYAVRRGTIIVISFVFILSFIASLSFGINHSPQGNLSYTRAQRILIHVLDAVVYTITNQWGFVVTALCCVFFWNFIRNSNWPKARNIPATKRRTDAVEFLLQLAAAPKWPLAIGSVLILAGVLILLVGGGHSSMANKLIGALTSELGFAFFIAYILAVTLEMHTRVEHERRISRGILSYIYNMDIDDRMFSHTEKHIFNSSFYRREAIVEYDFYCIDKNIGRVLVKVSFYYIVENISSKVEDYPIRTIVERPDRTDLSSSLGSEETYGLNKIYIAGKVIDPDDMKKARELQQYGDDDDLESIHYHSLNPGESVRIQTVNITEKYIIDTELWRSLWPCDGVTLKIRWHDDMDLEFHANAVHPSVKFDLFDRDHNSLTASVHEPLFPQNGINFWWRPRNGAYGAWTAEPREPTAALGANGSPVDTDSEPKT